MDSLNSSIILSLFVCFKSLKISKSSKGFLWNPSFIYSRQIPIGQLTNEMKDFVAIVIVSLVAFVQGQEICADALAKMLIAQWVSFKWLC